MTRAHESALPDGLAAASAAPDPSGFIPVVEQDASWTVVVAGAPGDALALPPEVAESVLTVGDGHFGTRGVLEEATNAGSVLANGVYDESVEELPVLLAGPGWTGLQLPASGEGGGLDRRVLDLRTGLLYRSRDAGRLRTVRFCSLARPGTM
ncbi:MAG: hypothetical protein WCG47_22220, partial [Dermatophilaceae bacterium]